MKHKINLPAKGLRKRNYIDQNTHPYRCIQCERTMNPTDWLIGAVCMKCCRNNHKRVAGVKLG